MSELLFDYIATDRRGSRQAGVIAAEHVDEAADRLRRMGLRPAVVNEKRSSALQADLHLPFAGKLGAKRRIRNDLAIFSRQLATMVAAGLPLLRCISTLSAQNSATPLGPVLADVGSDVSSGEPFSAALAKHSDWFDDFYVSMVKAGEASGDLDGVLEQLAETSEKTAELRRKVRSALTYPVAIACLAGLIVLAMLVFLVPTMAKIFEDLDGQLPLPTRIVIFISNPLVKMVPFAGGAPLSSSLLRALIIGGLFFITKRMLRRWKATEDGRYAIDKMKLKMPVFGDLMVRTALARFSRSMSVLISSGIPIVDSLAIAQRVIGNAVLAEAVAETAEQVKAGAPFGMSLAQHAVFPPMLTQMVAVGEDTGEVDRLLDKVAEFYESEVSAKVESLTALLEPIMLVGMGAVIGGMVISLYLPMFKVITLIK
ncbi:MAG: type II secretion system F family protein [Acidimicrobiia bacterium]